MDPKPLPSARLDSLDAERFRDMVASPPFALLRARLEAELERARGACEGHEERVALYRAQGRCAALRTALALPALILKEIEKPRVP